VLPSSHRMMRFPVEVVLGIAAHTRGRRFRFPLAARDDFPEPVAVLAGGRFWRREDVLAWAERTLPLPPGAAAQGRRRVGIRARPATHPASQSGREEAPHGLAPGWLRRSTPKPFRHSNRRPRSRLRGRQPLAARGPRAVEELRVKNAPNRAAHDDGVRKPPHNLEDAGLVLLQLSPHRESRFRDSIIRALFV
jgi:hypothetical protein